MSQKLLVLSAFFLGLTAFCSYIGDDDVVYRFLDRKPTPHEAIIRIRWVMLKAVASIYGGFLLGSIVKKFLLGWCSIGLSKDPAVLIAFACVALVSLLIGVMQNGIRRVRGRPRRPLIDAVVWQRSLGSWGGR